MVFGQQLKSLYLSPTVFTNEKFKEMIQSLPSLTSLELPNSSFDSGSLKVLKSTMQFMSTLKQLNLRGCKQATGAVVHDLMCSMTGLEVLEADKITDDDISKDDRVWACSRRLWKLSVDILSVPRVREGENRRTCRQDVVLGRLSTLENLRVLKLSSSELPSLPWQYFRGLRLTLERGLDVLKTLRRLERIKCPPSWRDGHTVWGEAEARWILKHWVNLKVVEGVCMEQVSTGLMDHLFGTGIDED